MLDNNYHAFVANVAAARKIPMEKMPDIAKGRVWTGAQAVQVGLVDELGGYDVALGAIRKQLNLGEDKFLSLKTYPAPPTPAEKLRKLLHRLGGAGAMAQIAPMLSRLHALLMPLFGVDGLGRQPVSARLPMMENLHE